MSKYSNKGKFSVLCYFQDEEGTAHGHDWARGFMRGTHLHHESWKELFEDEEHGGPLIPIMILAHEHDPDPEMRPYKDNIDAELRDKLILGISGAVTAIYRYFAPQRRAEILLRHAVTACGRPRRSSCEQSQREHS